MKKTSLTKALFVAGAVALAGAAQADAIFYPDGTVVELGDTDISEVAVNGDLDTRVLGAGAASLGTSTTTTTTTTVGAPRMEYVQPNINWDRGTAMTQMRSNHHLVGGAQLDDRTRTQSAATFDVPARAGAQSLIHPMYC